MPSGSASAAQFFVGVEGTGVNTALRRYTSGGAPVVLEVKAWTVEGPLIPRHIRVGAADMATHAIDTRDFPANVEGTGTSSTFVGHSQ